MEFEQWLVTFRRDLEILVITWVDLNHVADTTACQAFDQYTEGMWANKLWYVLARDPEHPFLVFFSMLLLIVFLSIHFLYNQDHDFFSDVDKYKLTREIVIIPNLAGAFWSWVVTLISISRCHLSIHLRTATLAPFYLLSLGKLPTSCWGPFLEQGEGLVFLTMSRSCPSNEWQSSNISHWFKVLSKLSHFIGIQRFIPLAWFLWVRIPTSSKVHKKYLSNSTLLISSHQKLKSNRLKAKRKYIGSYHCKDQEVA